MFGTREPYAWPCEALCLAQGGTFWLSDALRLGLWSPVLVYEASAFGPGKLLVAVRTLASGSKERNLALWSPMFDFGSHLWPFEALHWTRWSTACPMKPMFGPTKPHVPLRNPTLIMWTLIVGPMKPYVWP